nr:MAG TPA: hypothetical protein [Caudoviricetes sp.]
MILRSLVSIYIIPHCIIFKKFQKHFRKTTSVSPISERVIFLKLKRLLCVLADSYRRIIT